MFESIISGVVGLVGLVLFLWVWGDIMERIPPKLEIKTAPLDAAQIGIWVEVEQFALEEFRVGHVGEWELGHEVRIACKGTVEIDRQANEQRRVSVTLEAFRDAYKRTTVIGWAVDKESVLEVRLRLGPDEVRDVLNELRLAKRSDIHVRGWKGEKHFQIDHFSLAPKY